MHPSIYLSIYLFLQTLRVDRDPKPMADFTLLYRSYITDDASIIIRPTTTSIIIIIKIIITIIIINTSYISWQHRSFSINTWLSRSRSHFVIPMQHHPHDTSYHPIMAALQYDLTFAEASSSSQSSISSWSTYQSWCS